MLKEKSSSELIFSPIFQSPDKPSAKLAVEQVFAREYAFLRQYYILAWPAIKELKAAHLLDRNWIKDEIETFLSEMDRGLIILDGLEGTGKTTFMAQLAYEWCSIHHFITLPKGTKGIDLARCNLGAQIIREFKMSDWITPHRFQESSHSQNFLDELLLEASHKNKDSLPRQKIILIVDGLEDIGFLFEQNGLGIPGDLPENVYFIISQSSDVNSFKSQKNIRNIHLGPESHNHVSDLILFSQKTLDDPAYVNLGNPVEKEQLVLMLMEKSQGNWLLLSQILQQLKNYNYTKIAIDDIKENLPDNLLSAYLRTFLNIKDIDHAEWYRYILPILGVLTAYPEPISRNQLNREAGLSVDFRLSNHFIDQVLSPFLSIDFQERYHFTHSSLKSFLSGRLTSKGLSSQEEAFLQEIVDNSKQYHLRFAHEILSSWGNIDEGLPGLRDLKELNLRDEYGLNYLSTHLEGSGSIDDLQKLLMMEWQNPINRKLQPGLKLSGSKKGAVESNREGTPRFTNGWYDVKFSKGGLNGYLDDVQIAWKNSLGVEEHILYALITSSVITSQSTDGKPINDQEEQDQLLSRLATCLAEMGEPNAALVTVEMVSKSRWKNQAYADIVHYLPSQSIPTVLRYCQNLDDPMGKDQIITNCALRLTELSKPVQSLDIARQLSSDSLRNKLLAQLAKNLVNANQVEMALEAIHYISSEAIKLDLIIEYSKNMDRDALQISLSLIRTFHDPNKKAQGMAGLAPYLPPALQRECFQWLVQFNEENRSKALVGLIPHLRETMLKDALSAARDIKDESLRAPVLVELSIRTASTGEPAKALKLIQAILGENYKASAIQGVAPFLSDEQRYEVLSIVQTFKDTNSQNRAYEVLIPFLYDPILKELLAKAFLFKTENSKGIILKALSKRYLELGETARSVEIIRQCASLEIRARLLADLASLWPEEVKSEILTMTLEFTNSEFLTIALLDLLPHLNQVALLDALYVVTQLPTHGWLGVNQRTEILIQMIPLLAQSGESNRSLTTLREFTDDDAIARALTNLFPLLPDEYQTAAITTVQMIQDPLKRVSTLVDLMPILPVSQINNVLGFLENLGDESLRIQGLIALAPRILPDQFQSYLDIILGIQEKTLRRQAFNAVVPNWLLLPVPQSLNLWRDIIQVLSHRHRPELLLDLKSLAPVISDLGGISAINATLKTIKDVTRWWN